MGNSVWTSIDSNKCHHHHHHHHWKKKEKDVNRSVPTPLVSCYARHSRWNPTTTRMMPRRRGSTVRPSYSVKCLHHNHRPHRKRRRRRGSIPMSHTSSMMTTVGCIRCSTAVVGAATTTT